MKIGVARTTNPLKERHTATQPQPCVCTSHGIVRKAMRQTTDNPETETSAIQSMTLFH